MAFIGRLTVFAAAVFISGFVVVAIKHIAGWELRTLTGFVAAYVGCWLFPTMRAWERR